MLPTEVESIFLVLCLVVICNHQSFVASTVDYNVCLTTCLFAVHPLTVEQCCRVDVEAILVVIPAVARVSKHNDVVVDVI